MAEEEQWGLDGKDENEPEEDESTFDSEDIENLTKSTWFLENSPIHTETLGRVIKNYNYTKDQIAKTGIRIFPLGFRRGFKKLAGRYKVSLQTLGMDASLLGFMILLHHPQIRSLLSVYSKKCSQAETDGNDPAVYKEAIRAVEERDVKATFVNPVVFATSIALYKEMTGPLSTLSDALGLYDAKVYCYACMLAMLTVRLPSNIRLLFEEELRHFWNTVEKRLKGLK